MGSSSYLTDVNGDVSQHVEYLPYGELFLEERNNKWNTPYKFNAKELDEETGLYYVSQRYHDPKINIWLSVDQLRAKYPNISSYAFCAGNPVKYVDPDGRQFIHHSVSRIIAQYGQIRIKLENLHNFTRNQILDFSNDFHNWKEGELGASIEVAHLSFQSVPLPDPGTYSMDGSLGAATGNPAEHTVQNPNTKSSNYTQSDKRYNNQTISGASGATRAAARGMLVLDIAITSLQLTGTWSVYDDMKKIKQNLGILKGAVNMVNSAVASGIIPKKYQNQTNMLDILNVVYQGENTTKDKNIMNIGIQILKANNIYDPNKIKN